MEKEFNLSERALTKEYDIRHLTYKDEEGIFRIKDIKKFIKLLKEEIFVYDSCGKCIPKKVLKRANEGILKKINKLAGDKLI